MEGFALNNIKDCYMGNSQVTAIYLGSDKIWPATHSYANDYFTIVTLIDNNSFRFIIPDNTPTQTIYYSLDNGTTWNEYLIKHNQTVYITLNINDILMLKGSIDRFVQIESTEVYRAFGNLHSLFYGDNFKNNNNLPANFFQPSLFTGSKIMSAEDLIMPATTLTQHCYRGMFSGCTSLAGAPALPATTLADYCYQGMFIGCTSLENAPALPATTLTQYCYSNMFYLCSSLYNITCLATDISATDCTLGWLYGVASTGIFTKAYEASQWTRGYNGVPIGWTVQDV